MAVRQIIYVDNPRLRLKSKKVKTFGPALEALARDMLETMEAANGLGLAAPQIDVHQRVVVIKLPEDEEDPQSGRTYIMVNPEIVKALGEEEDQEGCLSVPGWWGLVKRATTVTVKAQDLKGKAFRLKAHGLLARAVQHEIDHLNGVLFIDRVEGPDKLFKVEREAETEPIEQREILPSPTADQPIA